MGLVAGVEPFWGRILLMDLDSGEEEEIQTNMILAENYEETLIEAGLIFSKLKNYKMPKTTVIELVECQSGKVNEGIQNAAKKSNLKNIVFLDFEESRIISILDQIRFNSKIEKIIAIIEIWKHEIFGHLLEVKSSTKFKKIGYFSFQEIRGISEKNLIEILKEIKFLKIPEIILFSEFDENSKIKKKIIQKIVSEKLPEAEVAYFDPEIRRGTVIKAKAVAEAVVGTVVGTVAETVVGTIAETFVESEKKENFKVTVEKSSKANNFNQLGLLK